MLGDTVSPVIGGKDSEVHSVLLVLYFPHHGIKKRLHFLTHLNVWDFYRTLPRPRSVWIEVEEEPIAWYWKLWGYGGMAVVYSGFVGYLCLPYAP